LTPFSKTHQLACCRILYLDRRHIPKNNYLSYYYYNNQNQKNQLSKVSYHPTNHAIESSPFHHSILASLCGRRLHYFDIHDGDPSDDEPCALLR
jgi:hypothetical protein